MMFSIRKILILLSALAVLAAGMSAPALAADKTIKLAYVQGWPSSALTTKLAARVIENNLGYDVALQNMTAGPMFQAVSSGNLDGTLSLWLPKTHAAYYKKLWPKMVNLGPNLVGTRLGLAVPKYVDVNSIKDLKKHAGEFNHKIIGVDAGSGINMNTRQAIKEYGLDGMRLVTSSTAAMAAELKRAIDKHEPIVVTGWTPLWIWSRFDLKYLHDPKKIYGHGAYIDTVVNPSVLKKEPQVFFFLKRFYLKLSELNKLEDKVQKGTSQDEAVEEWLKTHQKQVKTWLAGSDGGL